MKPRSFEAQMRAGERFHALRVPENTWPVVRVDGRGFSRLTAAQFQKPFDRRFADAMIETARALLESWDGSFVYVQSDEISLLLPRDFSGFGRGVEKLISLVAAQTSVRFSAFVGCEATFDARVWLGETPSEVADYFHWRQSDARRNALSLWCYWTLRGENRSARNVTKQLNGLTADEKKQLLFERGLNFDDLPAWQRSGIGLKWQSFEKIGHDPRVGEVRAIRRRVHVEEELAFGKPFAREIEALVEMQDTNNKKP